MFSLDDTKPCVETHDWFYLSDTKFPSDGSPVYLQVGSSDADTHILYTVISGNKVIADGATDLSNQLSTRALTYKEEYGEKKIHVFNSKSASIGETLIAMKIAECEDKGMTFEEVIDTVETYIEDQTYVLFYLESLRSPS
mgnify:CR=1 FL=1